MQRVCGAGTTRDRLVFGVRGENGPPRPAGVYTSPLWAPVHGWVSPHPATSALCAEELETLFMLYGADGGP